MFGGKPKPSPHQERFDRLAAEQAARRRKAEAKRQAAARRGEKRRSTNQLRKDLDEIQKGRIPTRRGF